jgi:hypothetical protein
VWCARPARRKDLSPSKTSPAKFFRRDILEGIPYLLPIFIDFGSKKFPSVRPLEGIPYEGISNEAPSFSWIWQENAFFAYIPVLCGKPGSGC